MRLTIIADDGTNQIGQTADGLLYRREEWDRSDEGEQRFGWVATDTYMIVKRPGAPDTIVTGVDFATESSESSEVAQT